MKEQKTTHSGFTLIEMLVVISIIVLLASLLFPAINSALRRSQQTKCLSNLKNFGIGWNANYLETISGPHENEMDAIFPWLSTMVPDFLDFGNLRCPADESKGRYGSKPEENAEFFAMDKEGFPETDDNSNNPASGQYAQRNEDVEFNSYMYEFNDATISWGWSNYILGSGDHSFATEELVDINGDGRITWGEVKVTQYTYGDTFSMGAYGPSQFPLVRCFHHFKDKVVRVRNLDNPNAPTVTTSVRVMNLAMDGSVFISGLQWEYPLEP
ncbi:type II secretion system protein [Kiritimatiellota bacterium B12222]|nr:type II secretion system protein [Kiritimatiellota bacterium B12222]